MFSFKELTKEFPQQTVKTSDGHNSSMCVVPSKTPISPWPDPAYPHFIVNAVSDEATTLVLQPH